METVVDVSVQTDEFVLQETLAGVSNAEFEAVRFAVSRPNCTMPFLWGSADRMDRLDTALRNDPTVADATRLSSEDGRGLYAIDWALGWETVIEDFVEGDGTVLEVHGTAHEWNLRVLFRDRATASETYQAWCHDGTGPSLCRINGLTGEEYGERGLSSTQHRAIAKAFEAGYYEVPRRTTLEELAADFEVSHQALSECLRRGHRNLVEQMVSESPPEMTQST
jgi:predicted DNA binding protein